MENNEQKITKLAESIDDITSVDLALELSECDDEQIEELCLKLDDEELASILEKDNKEK